MFIFPVQNTKANIVSLKQILKYFTIIYVMTGKKEEGVAPRESV